MSEDTNTATMEAADDRGLLEALDDALPAAEGDRIYTTEAEAAAARASTPAPQAEEDSSDSADKPDKAEDSSGDNVDPTKDLADDLLADTTPDDILADLEVEPDTSKWTPEQAYAFKTVKGQLKELKPRVSELEQQIAEKDARVKELEAVSSGDEVANLKKQIEDYEKRLVVSDLENSVVYQEQIAKPIEDLVSEINSFADRHNLNPRDITDAINLPDAAAQDERLGELLTGIGDRERKRVYDVIDVMDSVMERRQRIMENAEAAAAEAKALEEEREKASLVERAAERRQAATQVAAKVGEKLPFLSEMEGLDLKGIADEVAGVDPSALDAVKHSYHAISAKLLPHLAKRVVAAEQERESLLEQLAAYKSSAPSAGGPSGGAAVSDGSDVNEDESMLDAINRRLGS